MTTISGQSRPFRDFVPVHLRTVKCREQAGTSVAGNNVEAHDDRSEDDLPRRKGAIGFSAFAALAPEDNEANEDQEDFGGLMVHFILLHESPRGYSDCDQVCYQSIFY